MTDIALKIDGGEIEDERIGWRMDTQKLHCLLMVNDRLSEKLSDRAGEAFFRAFVVEDRTTGEVLMNMRFRYKEGDSWMRMTLSEDKSLLSLKEKIEYLADGMEKTQRTALTMMSGGSAPPKEAVLRYYPPDPDSSEKTLDWLMERDLIFVAGLRSGGVRIPVQRD